MTYNDTHNDTNEMTHIETHTIIYTMIHTIKHKKKVSFDFLLKPNNRKTLDERISFINFYQKINQKEKKS